MPARNVVIFACEVCGLDMEGVPHIAVQVKDDNAHSYSTPTMSVPNPDVARVRTDFFCKEHAAGLDAEVDRLQGEIKKAAKLK